jgi:Na+/melibiose symporter-like transporter
MPPEPSRRTIAFYASASFPLSVVGLPLVVYIPPLYGELGIPLALLGTILMLARLSDVFTDPLSACFRTGHARGSGVASLGF